MMRRMKDACPSSQSNNSLYKNGRLVIITLWLERNHANKGDNMDYDRMMDKFGDEIEEMKREEARVDWELEEIPRLVDWEDGESI